MTNGKLVQIIDVKLIPYVPVVNTEISFICYQKDNLQLIQVFDNLPIDEIVDKYGIKERPNGYDVSPLLYRYILITYNDDKQQYAFHSFTAN